METKYDEVLAKVTDFLKNETKSETVVGKEFKLGEYSCVPVVRMGLGFGFGGGQGDFSGKGANGERAGAGAGFGIEPVGFLVSRGDEISFIATSTSRGLTSAIERVPDLLDKLIDRRKDKRESNE